VRGIVRARYAGSNMQRLVAVVGILSIFGFGASAQTKEKSQTEQICLLRL
jgi:hypothetical protein